MTNPTLTNINVKFVKEMLYPAVTICNMSPYKRSAINASAVMMSHLLHRSRLGDVFPPIDYTNPVYSELNDSVSEDRLDKVSFGLNDNFAFCEHDKHLVSCETILTPKITQWEKCFTYNGNEKLRMEGRVKSSTTGSPTALTFYMDIKQHEYVFNTNTAAGIKIVLHDPEEEPDIINTGFVSSPGMSTYVSVKMTKRN
ncbi:acid-sensing ion channel 4-A-like [Mytilus californianus]|uniref:acid-sensing ion channel 4-A-like n=1 Tax=Mytilus californianus TaxID=6549 RepID=UPI002246A9A2|nr:acid-sensing ion channel 4-A-like [Mytilus californianus]